MPGRIFTFYSYKGGTGRSMALANFAWIVAASGKRVLAIDWDLEAPGLHRYFRPFLLDPDLFETDGLIDTFWNLAAVALERAANPGIEEHLEIVEALEDATRRLDRKFPTGGYIDFVGAGRQGATYSQRVNTFDWKRFYDLGGASTLGAAKTHLCSQYDWVLIDSRTGVSDTSGICTIQMPDAVVACFTLNRQSIDGIVAILKSIRAFRSANIDGSKIEFFPLATRIENAEQARLELARGYYRPALAEFLPKAVQARSREYWDKMEIAYRPAYAFEEVLSAFGDATGAKGAADTMLSQVEAMAQRITSDDTLRMPEIPDEDRTDVLKKYALGRLMQSAEMEERAPAHDSTDAEVVRGIFAKEQLWRSSGFYWRRLLSPRELDLITIDDRKEFGRNMAFYVTQSERAQQFFGRLDLAFVSSLAFAVASVAISYYGWWLRLWYWPSLLHPAVLTYIFLIAWFLSMSVWSVMVSQARYAPYGIRLSEVFFLNLRGPLRPKIRDYDPNERPTLGRPNTSS
jgi:cellulose biosynthesis protein BcsQ